MNKKNNNKTRIFIDNGIPEESLTKQMDTSELDFGYSYRFMIKDLIRRSDIIIARGIKQEECRMRFDAGTGLPYNIMPKEMHCSYIPLLGGRMLKGLVYISKEGGSYLIASILEYRKDKKGLQMVSPAGASEQRFRLSVSDNIDVSEFQDADIPLNPAVEEAFASDSIWAAFHCNTKIGRAVYIHDYIGRRYKNNMRDIPQVASALYRAAGIPCIIVKGFCLKNGISLKIKPGERFKPNCEWNMIWLEGAWRFVDIARDITISHGEYPAYNDFLASPEWFGQNHVSIEAYQAV